MFEFHVRHAEPTRVGLAIETLSCPEREQQLSVKSSQVNTNILSTVA